MNMDVDVDAKNFSEKRKNRKKGKKEDVNADVNS